MRTRDARRSGQRRSVVILDRREPADTATKEVASVQSLAKRKFGWVLGLAGATASLTALLVYYGFLSRTAVYAQAGLPQLSSDPAAMIELGATAFVDSLSVVLESWRLRVAIGLFLGLTALLLCRNQRRVARLLQSREACFVAHVGLLAVTCAFALTFLEVSNRISQTGKATATVHRGEDGDSAPDDQPMEFGTYVESSMAREKASVAGDNWLLNALWSLSEPATAGREGDAVDDDRFFFVRGPAAAREAARGVFGWMLLGAVASAVALLCVYGWRRSLSEDAASAFPFLPTLRWLIEPATMVLCLLSLLLTPVAHGALAVPTVGHESVVAQIKATKECRTAVFETPEAAGKAWAHGCTPGQYGALNRERGLGDELVRRYAVAQMEVVQARPSEVQDYRRVMKEFRAATDALFDDIAKAQCADAVEDAWSLRPAPEFVQRRPEAGQYYWRRLEDLLKDSSLLFGNILRYPRGSDASRLALLTTVAGDSAGQAQWAIVEVPRECIDHTRIDHARVNPDTVRTHSRQAQSRLSGSVSVWNRPAEFRYLRPAALTVVLDLLEDKTLPAASRDMAITFTGTAAKLFKSSQPALGDRALKTLEKLAAGGAGEGHRGAAVTALHVMGGPRAAKTLAKLVAEKKLPEDRNTSITAAGFLLRDLRDALPEAQPGDTHAKQEDAKDPDVTALRTLIQHEATRNAHKLRGTACTALHLSRDPELGTVALTALKESLTRRAADTAGPCVTAVGLLHFDSPEARAVFLDIVRGEKYSAWLPDGVRGAALTTLYRLGLWNEAALLANLVQAGYERALRFVEDADRVSMGRVLLQCATDPDRELSDRCIEAVGYLTGWALNDQDLDPVAGDVISGLRADDRSEAASALCRAVARAHRHRGSEPLEAVEAVCPELAQAAVLQQLAQAEVLQELLAQIQPDEPTDEHY